MKLSDINPHIRYATIHYNYIEKQYDSICYDCRLFFVKEADGFCKVGSQKYPFSNNMIFFFPPGTRYHLYPATQNQKPVFMVFDFDLVNTFSYLDKSLGTANILNFIPEKIPSYELPREFTEVIVKTVPDLSGPLERCCNEFLMQNSLYKEITSALFKLCLLELLQKYKSDPEQQKIVPVLEYIHSNYYNTELNNASIASTFNYHPYYLSQLIKQTTGQTLHQYIMQYRIKMAGKHLLTTDDAIHVVAWKSGFCSTAYFIKMFKKETGVTPKVYRKERIPFLF